MKIAMMTNNYKPTVGGVPISIERLTDSLGQRGHEVTIFAPQHENAQPERGVFRYASSGRTLDTGFVIPSIFDPELEEHFYNNHYDVIHVHHPVIIGYTAVHMARKYDIPLAFTYHTRYEQYLHHLNIYKRIESRSKTLTSSIQKAVTLHNRIFTNRCELVFAPTKTIRDYLQEHGTQSSVEVMSTGLADSDFEWSDDNVKTIRGKYLSGKKYLFCSVSRLDKEKNIPFLLKAMKTLKDECGDCFRLLLIGDGAYRGQLEKDVRRIGLSHCVSFVGTCDHDELADYYKACDMFLFSSKSETQGIVLLEAMAVGLPVVAVDASGVCDVIRDDYNGWKTSEDVHEFVFRLRGIMENPHLYLQLSEGAIATAKAMTARDMAAKAEACYNALVYNKRAVTSGLFRARA